MNKILFVELLGGVGDLVIALPAIHALALSHPQAQVTVLTFAPGADLLRSDPLVHRVLLAERGDAAHPERPRRTLEELLAGERFDLIVTDTTYAGIDELLQVSGARVIANLWHSPPAGQLIEERFLQILAQEGAIRPWALNMRARLSLDAADRVWAAAQFARPARRVLLHPHAGMPIKAWPDDRLVSLGRALHDELGLQIVIPEGIGAEAGRAREVAQEVGHGAILLPTCTLPQFAAAATHADLVVGADTGPVRVAGAVGALTITLFGPSWHGRYGQRPPNVNLQGFPECPQRVVDDFTREPCWYAGGCPFERWQSCMEDISVGDVLRAASRLLKMTSWWGKPLAQEVLEGP
jgi:ADP-heptose:LPS heptosyltransferase